MRHLLTPEDFSVEELDALFNLADDIGADRSRYTSVCAGKKLATCFYEPSTRTRLSIETAMLNLGVLYCENKEGFANPSRGLELVKRAAEGGKATAMFDLYLYYRFGRGVTQIDEKQARYWLDKAAEKGHAKALEIQKSWR